MSFVAILAQSGDSGGAAGSSAAGGLPIDTIWSNIMSLTVVEALVFISFGVVCLFYGWRIFKILVVISFGLLGLVMGLSIAGKIIGLNNQLAGGLVGMGVLAVLAVPLMRWAVSILGATAGAIIAAGLWYACGLNESYMWAGALTGMVAGGMISFIVFKVAIILFSSLGGSALVAMGGMALLNRFTDMGEQLRQMSYTDKWFLPVVLMLPTFVGIILQHTFVKHSKEWNV